MLRDKMCSLTVRRAHRPRPLSLKTLGETPRTMEMFLKF